MADRRPLIAIPARFSTSASALRYRAEVTAHKLVSAVFAAGGEPVVLHPHAPGGRVSTEEVAERLAFADGILLPGGGDVAASWSGRPAHHSLYDVDEEQDAFDVAVARAAFASDVPLLAICRGLQVVNVALGGTLHGDMQELGGFARHHRNHVHRIEVEPDTLLGRATGPVVTASCYHHQCLDDVADRLRVIARSEDGVVEGAVRADDHAAWFLGVQWHPEDTAGEDPAQRAIFESLVAAARSTVPAT